MQFVLCVFIYCLQWFLYVAVLFFVHRGVDAWVSCGILFKKNKIKNNVGVFNGFIYLDFSFKLTSVLILFFLLLRFHCDLVQWQYVVPRKHLK